jgi:hypothetical protein
MSCIQFKEDRHFKNHLLLRRNSFLRLRNLCLFILERRFFNVLLIRTTAVFAIFTDFSQTKDETDPLLE